MSAPIGTPLLELSAVETWIGESHILQGVGFTVRPGPVRPADVHTYDDHRMAMSFALVGMRAPGVRILDPGCVAKTYPGFWDDLARVSGTASL